MNGVALTADHRRFPRSLRGGGRARTRNRRAISEVVSTLMMVAIVVALGVIVFTFASGAFTTLTGSFTHLITNRGNGVDEHFVVMQVVFSFSGAPGASVYVRNVGTISSILVSVYIVDQSTGAFVKQVPLTAAQGTLNAGTVLDVTNTLLSFTPSHGNAYSFTVTSNLGNSVTFDAEAT
jgi:flagellin-like protein